MKKIVTAMVLFFLPSWLANRIVRLWGCKIHGRVGFALLLCSKYDIASEAVIQSGCIVIVPCLRLEKGAIIKKFTVIKGGFSLVMCEKAVIKSFTKITNAPMLQYRPITLQLGTMSIIGLSSIIDMTGNVSIGDYTVFAGAGSEIWTHSYYHSKEVPKRFRIDGDVTVGNNVYIGSRCILTAGIAIADNISIGAGAVVSKSLTKPGLYVNQPLRFLEFDADEKLTACCERIPEAPIDLVYRKKSAI